MAATTPDNLVEENAISLREKYESLCRDLNMDRQTEVDAWKKYLEVSQHCTLDGDIVHWFCCVLYAACRERPTPTVGEPQSVVMGNCVPLNNLLRTCNMSIYDFTTKIKLWADMANLSQDFLRQIRELERKFGITFTLYHRYTNIFEQLFICPPNERKNTKFSTIQNRCSYAKLKDLCWRLFLCAKNEQPISTVDLVTSFHLLICCMDLVYINVLAECRIDLINPEFKNLPKNWNKPEFDPNSVRDHCIIEHLCAIAGAIPTEALNMKVNSFKMKIERFFQKNAIYGDEKTFLGLISNTNIDANLKSLNCSYEQYVLSVGEFDERILVNHRLPSATEMNENETERDQQTQELKSLTPATPYTRQQFLPHQENFMEPVANATNNVKQLQSIARITEPTEFVRQAGNDVVDKIEEIVENMSQSFYNKFPISAEASNRFQLAKSLYYYLLDNIVRAEIKTKPNIDLKCLLGQRPFNEMLLACCVELVLEAYNHAQLKFPWILNCFSISAFHFLKIIEIVVLRHENVLTRALIKHLNAIEETCLESLVWQRDSPVWNIINTWSKPLPTWTDVDGNNMAMRPPNSPMLNTAYETFNSTPGPKSPMPMQVNDTARRDLFNTNNKAFAQADAVVSHSVTPKEKPTTSKQLEVGNKRAGSLPIFLRKFYKLAWIRIFKLCIELDIRDKIIQQKIWNLFEHSITVQTTLVKDRHLDQMLMCAIYIFIRVGEVSDKKFSDIMRLYRKQPQSNSSIYREVLIHSPPEVSEPVYKDIIFYYNHIYVPSMTKFSLNFSEKRKSPSDLRLSPLPQEPLTIAKQLTQNHKLFVSHMQKSTTIDIQQSPNQLTYEFCKSPAKDLHRMNEKVSGSKRFLPFSNEEIAFDQKRSRDEMPIYMKKFKNIIEDREKGGK